MIGRVAIGVAVGEKPSHTHTHARTHTHTHTSLLSYGIIFGLDEGDDFVRRYYHQSNITHFYPHTAEMYRAFSEIGAVWQAVGAANKRPDVVAHGVKLSQLAPEVYRDLHTSLNKTVNITESPGHRCYTSRADGYGTFAGCNFRAVPEMFRSGALTAEQTHALYQTGLREIGHRE